MKKEKKTRASRNVKKSAPEQRRYSDNSSNLNDFGLEPPKIYRESQRKIEQERIKKESARGQKEKHITTAQKRTKQTKKRKQKNKLRRIVISVLVAILTVSAVLAISLTSFFNITEFTVKGTEKYSKEEVVDSLTVKLGDRMFLSDFDKAGDYLQKNLPYVYSVNFKKKLPSTIEINITDAEPSYSIKNKDKTYILLDDNFKVLETKAKKSSGIRIKEADIKKAKAGYPIAFKNEKIQDCLKTLCNTVKAEGIDEITAIYSKGLSDNYVVYDNRITFKLGNCDKLEKKLYQGCAACEKLNESNPNAKGEMNITGDKQLYFTEE